MKHKRAGHQERRHQCQRKAHHHLRSGCRIEDLCRTRVRHDPKPNSDDQIRDAEQIPSDRSPAAPRRVELARMIMAVPPRSRVMAYLFYGSRRQTQERKKETEKEIGGRCISYSWKLKFAHRVSSPSRTTIQPGSAGLPALTVWAPDNTRLRT